MVAMSLKSSAPQASKPVSQALMPNTQYLLPIVADEKKGGASDDLRAPPKKICRPSGHILKVKSMP
jgi:hypothetical protein